MTRRSATFIGFLAILLWALLALMTAASGKVPPFQLTAMAFALGGSIGLVSILARRGNLGGLRQSLGVWLLGIAGLFGYHFAYFTALRNAPPVEAGLIAYLWPLLIVLFSALLPGERLRTHHVLGVVLGLAGAALIVTGGRGLHFQVEYAFGYTMALVCALTWSTYSVVSRRFAAVPTDVVAGFCLVTAILATVAHLLLEETVWPANALEWLAVVGLGMGPVGLAFYAWDIGVKHGDIQVLGSLSYVAPLLSTLVLIAAGFGTLNIAIGAACLLITGGALVASQDLLRAKSVDSGDTPA